MKYSFCHPFKNLLPTGGRNTCPTCRQNRVSSYCQLFSENFGRSYWTLCCVTYTRATIHEPDVIPVTLLV